MLCEVSILCFVDDTLFLLDANADRKRFLFHMKAARVQHLLRVARGVPQCQDKLLSLLIDSLIFILITDGGEFAAFYMDSIQTRAKKYPAT